jgi:hypothetical protein
VSLEEDALEDSGLFRRWQRREENRDRREQAHFNKLVIENGDPECEAVIAALEEGWKEGR